MDILLYIIKSSARMQLESPPHVHLVFVIISPFIDRTGRTSCKPLKQPIKEEKDSASAFQLKAVRPTMLGYIR